MSIIKAYHTCNEHAYNSILNTGIIKPFVDLEEIPQNDHFWGQYKTDGCVRQDRYYTYFYPIRPQAAEHWGNHGFVFDSEMLIRDFEACLCYDTGYIVSEFESKKEVYDLVYLDRAKFYSKNYGIQVPKLGPLYGDDALELLAQIERNVYRLCKPGTMEDLAQASIERELLLTLELRCPVAIPLDKAYSHYANVPDYRWHRPILPWEEDGFTAKPHEVLHHSLWEERGYEKRLNQ